MLGGVEICLEGCGKNTWKDKWENALEGEVKMTKKVWEKCQ